MKMPIEERYAQVVSTVEQDPSILGLQTYEYLQNNATSQRDEFIQSDDPIEIEYLNLDLTELQKKEIVLRDLLVSLYDADDTPEHQAMYRALEERHSQVCMLGWAAQMMDTDLPDSTRSEYEDWYQNADAAIHGTPEREVFAAMALRNILPQIEFDIQPHHEATSQIQEELREMLGHIELTETRSVFMPSDEMLSTLGKIIDDRFGKSIEHINPNRIYTMAETADALSQVLQNEGLDTKGWIAEIDENGNSLAVSSSKKLIKVGKNRKDISGEVLRTRAVHEIGVHAIRSAVALESGVMPAVYGLDGYIDFEEGVATAFEDAMNREQKIHGEQYYLAIGLAQGLDNHEPRTFREVYEIIWRYVSLRKYDGNSDLAQKSIDAAKRNGFNRCVRIFRGTTGNQPGITYNKDLTYYNGQEKAWTVLKDVLEPDDLKIVLAGKVDLTDELHKKIAEMIINGDKSTE